MLTCWVVGSRPSGSDGAGAVARASSIKSELRGSGSEHPLDVITAILLLLSHK